MPVQRILHLWSLDTTPLDQTTAEQLEADQLLNCGSILHLVRGANEAYCKSAPVVDQPRRSAGARTAGIARRNSVTDMGFGPGHCS